MKKCPNCSKEVPDYATKCKYCDYSFENHSENSNNSAVENGGIKENKIKNINPTKSCAMMLLVILSILLIIYFSSKSGNSNSKKPTPTPDLRSMSYIMCQHFTDDQLKAPSTAEYQSYYDIKNTIKDLGNQIYSMTYYVDAQNSFGAMLRNTFYCKIRHGDGDMWYLDDLHLVE